MSPKKTPYAFFNNKRVYAHLIACIENNPLLGFLWEDPF